MKPRAGIVFGLLFVALAASRACHVAILWEPETLPLAAAQQMLDGKALYREVWYDKPPLAPAVCLLWGAQAGWLLRLAGALYGLLACALIYRFAKQAWGEREGLLAAGLLGFFLIFWLPVGVIPLGPDLLALAPHIAAVYLAWRGRALWSGVAAGVAFLANSKAAFVLAACALWQFRSLPQLALGFVLPNLAALAWLGAQGALKDYWEQVWQLGFLYARSPVVERPLAEGLLRTANWLGFHAALVLGAACYGWRERDSNRWRMALWAALSLAAVAAGGRFFPRYYLQLLPVMTLAAARGIALAGGWRAVVLFALLVPLARFGPRYGLLAQDLVAGCEHGWRDLAMDRDSRAAARLVARLARPGDTLFVWGYRPELYVYTRLPAATRFLESQPLTGVFADRHLTQSASLAPEWARENRKELLRARPTFVVDGLGSYNPRLSIERFEDLSPWMSDYELAARTGSTVIYRLLPRPAR